MNDTKSWLASKTIWGGLIAVAAAVAGWFGYSLAAGDQATLVDALVSIGGAVGGILAIVGRVMASKTVG